MSRTVVEHTWLEASHVDRAPAPYPSDKAVRCRRRGFAKGMFAVADTVKDEIDGRHVGSGTPLAIPESGSNTRRADALCKSNASRRKNCGRNLANVFRAAPIDHAAAETPSGESRIRVEMSHTGDKEADVSEHTMRAIREASVMCTDDVFFESLE